jgi:hypothetical protein
MHWAFAIVSALAVVATTSTPPPVSSLADRAGMCRGFDGLAFTFCVALCEARACDLRGADDPRCLVLQRGFARVTGGRASPCEAMPVVPPYEL